MIYLPEIGEKLQTLLNSNESSSYFFKVATTGFHLDANYSVDEHKNFIPVFIDSMGGNNDAVKVIKRSTQNIAVVIYFPVRFKNDFFALYDYLFDTFVAQVIDFGDVSGSCVCNISPAQFGEIVDLDLKNFASWEESIYKRAIDITEPYMSMTFSLFLTSFASGFIVGNNVSYTLTLTYTDNDNETQTLSETLVWTSSGTGVNNSPISQQLVDVDDYAKNTINITNYNKSIVAYIRNNDFWKRILAYYNNQNFNDVGTFTLTKTYTFDENTVLTYTFNQIVLTLNENVALGDLLSATITFGDKYSGD